MSASTFTPAKRFMLALSGLAYLFSAPFVVAAGLPFTALWIVVGLGLTRQMVMAVAPGWRRSTHVQRRDAGSTAGTTANPPQGDLPARFPEAA
jgi:hypothetical protein